MAKPMLVTLPFVLLLLDYWPLGRWQKALTPVKVPITAIEKSEKKKVKRRKADSIKEKEISTPINSRGHLISRLLWEKVPFILIAIILSIVTLWVQNKTGAVISIERLSFSGRFANAIISYVSYLGKTFWPVDLAVFYPYEYSLPFWQVLASCFILIGITIVVIYAFKKLPFLFVGWFWYLGTLIPVIGLVQVGKQAMADRYTYLPSIGIAIIVVWGIPLLFPREDIRKKILFPAGIAVLIILAVLTWQQCGYWKNSTALFNHTLQITKDNYLAESSIATALGKDGKTEEAIDHYNKAIDIYKKAIRIIPMDQARAYVNRGICYARLARYRQAIEDYNEAIRIIPNYADAYFNRGNAYSSVGQYQQAVENFNEAINLQPGYFAAYFNRGNAYLKLGQFKQAIEDYSRVISLKENFAGAYSNRGTIYFNQGNKELGCRDAQKVCALGFCKMLKEAKSKGLCI
jgi:tetratricopeptide (TPR) repeat protein